MTRNAAVASYTEFNNTGGVLPTLNVNVVPGVDPHVARPGPALWYNPAAFNQPADFTSGNGPRTEPDLLGPGYNSMDLSVTKRMPMGGERALEFRHRDQHAQSRQLELSRSEYRSGQRAQRGCRQNHWLSPGSIVQIGLKFSF